MKNTAKIMKCFRRPVFKIFVLALYSTNIVLSQIPVPAVVVQPAVLPTPQPIVTAAPTPAVAVQPAAPQAIVIGAYKDTTPSQQEANIYLNFENASLMSVINYLGEQKKINLIPNKELETTRVSLTTRNPLTLDRAWNVLLTLLETNGFTMIDVDSIYRIVPSKDNGKEPLPMYSSGTGTEPENLPDTDIVVRYVYFFKNMKAEVAQSILSKMISESNIVINKDLNICIIKDQCLNIKSAMKIVKALDIGGLSESISMIPLKWANADNVKKLFDDIIGQEKDERTIRFSSLITSKESTFFSSATKILAEPIKNSLILLGTQKNIEKIKAFIEKYIDLPIDDAASRLHIKELRYIKAQDIEPILNSIIQPPKGSAATDKGAVVIEGGYKVFEDVIIAAETDDDGSGSVSKRGGGNRLIIACNRDDWRRLEDFIDKLDKPQPQVAIEVMVIDVGLGQIKELGAQTFNIRGKPVARNLNADFTNLAAINTRVPPSDGSAGVVKNPLINIASPGVEGTESPTFITLGRAASATDPNPNNNNIWSIIKTLYNLNNTQIVSQPYAIANNNQQAEITLKTTKRVTGGFDVGKTISAIQKKIWLDATISAKITPHVSLSGTVDLDISIDIGDFVGNTTGDTPTRTTRSLVTKATMATGEVLVLGGLINSTQAESVAKTPILGDIPFIGTFFKSKRKEKTEQNLYVFIRPSVIKPRFEGAPDEYTQLKLDYAKYQIMKNDTYVQDRDPIQRWFFKPSNQTVQQKINDSARGILRPIDKYTYGRDRPKTVDIQNDPYFKVSESIEKARAVRENEKQRRQNAMINT